jgi:hypothetical protein
VARARRRAHIPLAALRAKQSQHQRRKLPRRRQAQLALAGSLNQGERNAGLSQGQKEAQEEV